MDKEKTTFKITLRAECLYYLEVEDEEELDQTLATIEGSAAMEKYFMDQLHQGNILIEPYEINEL
tara:strand:+ start:204 stop:398 length:195 start_codon:yes stop_codon:yes gene_type:complete